MAQYLIEILGDKLDVSNIKADESGQLPSPEALRGKILVKVKFQYGCLKVTDFLWCEEAVLRQLSHLTAFIIQSLKLTE